MVIVGSDPRPADRAQGAGPRHRRQRGRGPRGRRHGGHRGRGASRSSRCDEVFAQPGGRVDGKVVTDMASTKASVMEWAAAAGIDLVGGHPMCGKEHRASTPPTPTIFKGAPWVLTRDEPRRDGAGRGGRARTRWSWTPRPTTASSPGVSHAAFLLSVGYVLALSRPRRTGPRRRGSRLGVSRHEPARGRRPRAVRRASRAPTATTWSSSSTRSARAGAVCAATSRPTTRGWSSCSRRRVRSASAGPRDRDRDCSQASGSRVRSRCPATSRSRIAR